MKTQNLIITLVLVVLVVVSAVQAFALNGLKEEIKSGSFGSAKASTSVGATPSGLDDLPNMVGGC